MNEKKLDTSALKKELIRCKEKNELNTNDYLVNEINNIEFILTVIKDLTTDQLKDIKNDKDLQVKICEQIEAYKKESKLSYLEVVINLAHYINDFIDINYSIADISSKLSFFFYFINLDSEVNNGGFLQYYSSDYYKKEGEILLSLFYVVSHLNSSKKIVETFKSAIEGYEFCEDRESYSENEDEDCDLDFLIESAVAPLDRQYYKINDKFIKELKIYIKDQVKNRTLFQ